MTEALYAKATQALQIMQEIAATCLLPALGKIDLALIRVKLDNTIVTEIDQQAETVLTQQFARAFPDDLIFGEESFAADNTRMDLLAQDKPVWIIDPLDGTDTFAAGRPGWGILISYVQHGQPLIGIAYEVMGDQSMIAIAGYGVFLNGKKVTPAFTQKPASEMTGMTWKRNYKPHILQALEGNAHHFRALKQGVCFVTCCFLFLNGDVDFVLGNTSNPWDYLPLVLMLDELGGRSGKIMDGHGFSGDRLLKIKEAALAVNIASQWDQIRDKLFAGIAPKEIAAGIRITH